MANTSIKIINADFYRFSIASTCVVIIAALFLLQIHPLGALTFLLVPVVLTIQSGVELNFQTMQYRKFRSVLGIRTGEWKPYSNEHVLVLLNKSGSKSIVNPVFFQERSIADMYLELYIMDSTHTKRLYLYSSKNSQKMKRIVDHITQHSTFVLQAYSPATAKRR